MGWFSKKEKVPELPSAPSPPKLPDLPTDLEISNTAKLPPLPFNSFGKNITQEMAAVSGLGEEKEVLPSLPQTHFEEEQDISLIPSIAQEVLETEHKRRTIEIPEEKEKTITKQIGQIFVKITDFQKAQKDFREITKEISQIEKILAKFKETKAKEDGQIEKWNQDLQRTKAKLSEIDSDIFSKI